MWSNNWLRSTQIVEKAPGARYVRNKVASKASPIYVNTTPTGMTKV